MTRIHARIVGLLILALALSACGGASGSPDAAVETGATDTQAKLSLPPEFTLTFTESSGENPTQPVDSTTGETPSSTPTAQTSITRPRPVYTAGPLCDDAVFVSDATIPDGSAVNPGTPFTKTWIVRNTGTCNWTTAYTVAYGAGDAMSGVATPIPHNVDSGDETEVSLNLVAPLVVGTYTGHWQLKNAKGFYFGAALFVQIVVPTTYNPSTPTQTFTPDIPCDAAVYVADVTVPDGTEIDPGAPFTKTWRVRNTGRCGWTTAYTITFSGGDSMSGTATPIPNNVDPGDETDISVALVAPSIAGNYTGHWQLRNADGYYFGMDLFVQIVVMGNA